MNHTVWLTALFVAFVWSAEAQQSGKIPRIGLLTGASTAVAAPWIDAFRQGLRELGYIEGKNIVLEIRGGEAKPDRLAHLASELTGLKSTSLSPEETAQSMLLRKRPTRFPLS